MPSVIGDHDGPAFFIFVDGHMGTGGDYDCSNFFKYNISQGWHSARSTFEQPRVFLGSDIQGGIHRDSPRRVPQVPVPDPEMGPNNLAQQPQKLDISW